MWGQHVTRGAGRTILWGPFFPLLPLNGIQRLNSGVQVCFISCAILTAWYVFGFGCGVKREVICSILTSVSILQILAQSYLCSLDSDVIQILFMQRVLPKVNSTLLWTSPITLPWGDIVVYELAWLATLSPSATRQKVDISWKCSIIICYLKLPTLSWTCRLDSKNIIWKYFYDKPGKPNEKMKDLVPWGRTDSHLLPELTSAWEIS